VGHTAASRAYQMSTRQPTTMRQNKFLRPLSTTLHKRRRRIRSSSIYKPGNILAPLSTQRSQYQVSFSALVTGAMNIELFLSDSATE